MLWSLDAQGLAGTAAFDLLRGSPLNDDGRYESILPEYIRQMRGEVFISPQAYGIPPGLQINLRATGFDASWQDQSSRDVLAEAAFSDVTSAIEWARVRASVVYVRLGSSGDTVYSAGEHAAQDDDGVLPTWPPQEPLSGWWEPPAAPTVSQIDAVRAALTAGTMTSDEAANWAREQLWIALESDADDTILDSLATLARIAD